ncbi:MAG: exodeoxyribonuclease VII small subunit [Planctomycetota bacterium]|nr:MAG: exodeoxyribonuclease VII small subunit [Planctomycetota bacterium]
MTTKKAKRRTYEEAFADLAGIVDSLESGDLPLEEALRKYEQGVKALRECYDVLQAAEKKIMKLAKDAKGHLAEIPFEPEIEEE